MAHPPSSGGFDVEPDDLYAVSRNVAEQQDAYHQHAKQLLSGHSEYQASGGGGNAAAAFGAPYNKAASSVLHVWGRSVASIGGVSTGLTVTANNYVKAEEATNHKSSGSSANEHPPSVIEKAPNYPEPPSIYRDATAEGVDDFLDDLPAIEDAIQHVLLDRFKGFAKVAENLPLADSDELRALADLWHTAAQKHTDAGTEFSTQIAGITNTQNDEWQAAMHTFCRSIWGTTAWGSDPNRPSDGYIWGHGKKPGPHGPDHRNATSRPILEVQRDSAKKLADSCEEWADAADDARRKLKQIFVQAVKDTIKEIIGDFDVVEKAKLMLMGMNEIAAIFLQKLDQGAIAQAMEKYENRAHTIGESLTNLKDPLAEAARSAPTFAAEEARSEAVGNRALHEFKPDHTWNVPDDDKSKHAYPIDLASQEEKQAGNPNSHAHPIDKHVGKTDEQLTQRLRDDLRPNGKIAPTSSSTFKDMHDAQKFTQGNIDDNEQRIREWLSSSPPSSSLSIESQGAGNEITGRSVSKQDYMSQGDDAKPQNAHGVQTILRYEPNMTPKFVVLTSYPKD
ncbi:RNase A-like domain-containing protein [Streptomyces tubercidicus]